MSSQDVKTDPTSNASKSSDSRPGPWKWVLRSILLVLILAAAFYAPRIVAATTASLLLVAGAVYWWIRRKFKQIFEPFEDMELFPTEIEVSPDEQTELFHPSEVASMDSDLKAAGYVRVGRFKVKQMPAVILDAYHASAPSSYAVVYDAEYFEPWYDFVCEFEDGGSLTVSTTQIPEGMPRPPDKPMIRLPEADGPAAFRVFCEKIGDRAVAECAAADFATSLETYHAEEQAWQADHFRTQEKRDRAVREAFLLTIGWSAIEWDRRQDRVVFIHDGLQKWETVDHYADALENESEKLYERERARAERLVEKMPPRAAFSEMLRGAPPEHADDFEKLTALVEPFPCDVYLGPEETWDDEDDEDRGED